MEDVYAIVKSADDEGYVVILGATPDCEGQHQCSFGTLIGTTRPLEQIDEYSLNDSRGEPVRLIRGLKGYFFASDCGSYCSDAKIVWTEGKYRYVIGLKAAEKREMVTAANSAIENGARK